MRALLFALLLSALLVAQDAPAPGLVAVAEVEIGELAIPSGRGDAKTAHETFLRAHALHGEGRTAEAIPLYIAFLGMPGKEELPARYVRTARERVAALRRELRRRYDEAAALYAKDRVRGLALLTPLAESHPTLPVGRAARTLVDSDALQSAMADARRLAAEGRRPEAAQELEKAVRRCTAALRRYAAKRYLLDLGGPDLLTPGERVHGDAAGEPDPEAKADEGDTEIEISDD